MPYDPAGVGISPVPAGYDAIGRTFEVFILMDPIGSVDTMY